MPKSARTKVIEDNASVISTILMRRLMTKHQDTQAFKYGLIDKDGNILREPETDAEAESFTSIDKLTLKLKNILGPKIGTLNTFMYASSLLDDDALANFILKKGLAKNANTKRIAKDINKRSRRRRWLKNRN